jgi:Ni,Fe-hydrogenase III small subunit
MIKILIARFKQGYRTQPFPPKKDLLSERYLGLPHISPDATEEDCGACEADINVLGTLSYDLGRFGIQFVASPRHADGLVVTGAVTENMKLALEKTYRAMPSPKLVIAVGACAISGGPYIDHKETNNGVESVLVYHQEPLVNI